MSENESEALRRLKEVTLKPQTLRRVKRRIDYLSNFEGSPALFVSYLYKTAEMIYNEQIRPNAVCGPKCSHCCYVPVQVSNVEAFYIQIKTGIQANELIKPSVLIHDNTPCPFLKNDNCSIYEYRPFNCRVFASMDSPEFCKDPNKSHLVARYDATPALSVLSELLLQVSSNTDHPLIADVRHWFSPKKISVKNI